MFLVNDSARRKARAARPVEDIGVSFPPRTRVREYRDSPIGRIGMSEIVGIRRDYLSIAPRVRVRGELRAHNTFMVPATREGVRKQVRRIRPSEQERLEQLDAEIAQLNTERRELIAEAWKKGHAVTVKELVERAEEREAEREAQRREAKP